MGGRTAMLSAVTLGLYPYFWAAIGWDYVDGPGIAYYLLTVALLTKSAFSSRPRWSPIASGAAYAALLYSNLVWVMFSPILVLHCLGLRRPSGGMEWRRVVLTAMFWAALGAIAVTSHISSLDHVS